MMAETARLAPEEVKEYRATLYVSDWARMHLG